MRNETVINSMISGSLSSTLTTIIYQPLEVLKTRIQLDEPSKSESKQAKILGRVTLSASRLIHDHGLFYLWRGTGASLIRSVPGVGIYYASLSALQSHLSKQSHKPDNPTQAFYFGLAARSVVSFVTLPVTVVKVRYESGQFKYKNLLVAIKDAYCLGRLGWVGVAPTIMRDSLFSGIYYMCYTKLKSHSETATNHTSIDKDISHSRPNHSLNFFNGLLSGLIASIITNPLDVIKTNVQVNPDMSDKSARKVISILKQQNNGYLKFFDGLVPRSLRRTLIAASTWTGYEFAMSFLKN